MVLHTPDPPPIPDGLSEAEQQEYLRLHGIAYNLRHNMAAGYVYATVSSTIQTGCDDLEAHQLYMEKLRKDAGNPQDPIEQMLVEQFALIHHCIGAQSMKAAAATGLEEIRILVGGLARLFHTSTKAVLALKEYREPKPPKQFTLIKQQNLAHNQQVAYVEDVSGEEEALTAEDSEKSFCDNKQGGIYTEAIEHVEQINPLTRSDARCRRQEEQSEVEGSDA